MARTALALTERLRRSSTPSPAGCWVWNLKVSNRGYGQMGVRVGSRTVTRSAHRVSYEVFVGPVPAGLVIDHLCRNPLCVNPAHLEPVTQRENTLRSPVAQGSLNAAKTHCPHGHPYDEANTYVIYRPNYTERRCRACRARYRRARYHARKAA